MKRAFSVFTPMVGTIVITITLLIVASLLQSERFAVTGTLQSYKSIKMANVMKGVQGLIEQEIKVNVYQDAVGQSNVETGNCFNDWVVGEYYSKLSAPDKYDVKCIDLMKPVTITEVNAKMGDALAQSTIKNAIENFNKIYGKSSSDEKITLDYSGTKGMFSKVLEGVEDAGDGRVLIKLDFTKIQGEKVATIETSTGGSVDIYMQPVKKEFESTDPLIIYGEELGNLFQDFTILDSTWQNAGDLGTNPKMHPTSKGSLGDNHGYGNGSQWYHYDYVLHFRKPPAKNNEYITTDWSGKESFEFKTKKDEPVVIHEVLDELVNELETNPNYFNPMKDIAMNPVGSHPNNILKERHIDQLGRSLVYGEKQSGSIPGEIDKFTAGYLRIEPEKYEFEASKTSLDSFYDASETLKTKSERTIAPGGHLTTALHKHNTNWLVTLDHSGFSPGGKWDEYLSNHEATGRSLDDKMILIDTVEEYDEKFMEDLTSPSNTNNRLTETVKKIKDAVLGSPKLKSSMGFTTEQPEYNITVKSWQYYTLNEHLEGGDNWICGEVMAKYVPDCSDVATVSNINNLLNRIKIDMNANGKNGQSDKNMFFWTYPMNYTCPTFVLSAVKEEITLYRNSQDTPTEVNQRVYRATFKRNKTRYDEGPKGNPKLWEGSTLNSFDSSILNTEAEKRKEVKDDGTIVVRECKYSYQSIPAPGKIWKTCNWVTGKAIKPYEEVKK